MKKEEITLNNENIEKKDNSKTFTQEEVNEMLKEKEKEVKKAEAESLKKAKENKKYTVCIPLSELNPQDKKVTVGINDKYATIERGVETEVEAPVYEQLKNAGLI